VEIVLGLLAIGVAYGVFAGVTTAIATAADKRRCAKEPQWFDEALEKLKAIPAADDAERFMVCERFIAERINGPGTPMPRQHLEALAAYRLTAKRHLTLAGVFDVDGKDRIRLLLQNTLQDTAGLAAMVLRAGREMPLPEGLFDEVCDAALFLYTCCTGDFTYGMKDADAQKFEEYATEEQLAALKESREKGPFRFNTERFQQSFSYIVAAIRAERTIVYACPPHAGFVFRLVHNHIGDRDNRRAMIQAVVDRAQRGFENLYEGVLEANGAPFPSERPIKTACASSSLMRQDR
jgi:hypothetical protein